MSLKYAEKVEIARQRELDEYREQILEILESSKQLALDCDNLVKMRALKTRCEKISKPRQSLYDENKKNDMKRKYNENKERYLSTKKERREKIRKTCQVDVGDFFNGVSV